MDHDNNNNADRLLAGFEIKEDKAEKNRNKQSLYVRTKVNFISQMRDPADPEIPISRALPRTLDRIHQDVGNVVVLVLKYDTVLYTSQSFARGEWNQDTWQRRVLDLLIPIPTTIFENDELALMWAQWSGASTHFGVAENQETDFDTVVAEVEAIVRKFTPHREQADAEQPHDISVYQNQVLRARVHAICSTGNNENQRRKRIRAVAQHDQVVERFNRVSPLVGEADGALFACRILEG